jgi:hypothetical protein
MAKLSAVPHSDDAEQLDLLPAAHVKFTGMSGAALEDPAGLGDEQVFVVRAKCVGEGRVLRKDGEIRNTRTMDVIDVEFGEITPARSETQLSIPDDED